MKVLVLLGLIAISVAVNDNSPKQGMIFDEELSKELKHSRLGRTILQLAELTTMSNQFDFTQLFDAIDEVELSIQEGKTDENTAFQADYEQYVADVQFYNNQVTQYKAEVAQHEQDLTTLEEQLDYLSNFLQEKVQQLSDTSRNSAELSRLMQTLEATFTQQVTDFNAAISVLDQALEILQELGETPELIEKRRESMLQLGSDFKEKFDKFSHQRVFYQPLAESLIQMATDNYADQALVRKVLKLLQQLRVQLSGGLLSLQNQYEAQRVANQEILDQYNELIDSLANTVIPGLQDDIETTNADIATKKGLLADAQANLQDAEDNLAFTEDRWLKRQTSHKALLDQYNSELAVIAQAITALERGGIRRP